jgi:hypothetical protein
MVARKVRKITTADKLYRKPKIVKDPPVFGKFNKFVRREGMRVPTLSGQNEYLLSDADKIPLFVSGKQRQHLPDQIVEAFADVVTMYGDDPPPKILTPRFTPLPDVFEHDWYSKQWSDDTLIWSASTRTAPSPMDMLLSTAGVEPPSGIFYAVVLAAVDYELGLALTTGDLKHMHRITPHAILAAREPGLNGGLRYRGVSPALRRLHYLAERYIESNDGSIEPRELDRILSDDGDNSNDLDFGNE